MTSSGDAEDVTAAVEVSQSVETSPSAAAVSERSGCHLSVFSSPVSDLAFNLEVLSTDGSSSQTSSASDGYESLSGGGGRLARRRLSLVTDSLSSSITSRRSSDAGFVDSPSLDTLMSPTFCSPAQYSSQGSLLLQSQCSRFRRFQSMPLPFCGFEPTPPSMKPVPRVLSNSSADEAVLKDVPRSPRRSASDQVIHEKDSPSNVDVANGTARSQDTSRTLRRPLSDSTNICRGSQDIIGRHSDHQLLQPQRRLLHAALARRRSSCSSLEVHCRSPCNRENAEDAEFLGDMKSPTVAPGKPALLRHLSGLLCSPVIEDSENTPASLTDHSSNSDASDTIHGNDQGKTSAVRGLFRSPSVPCRVSRAQSGYLIGRRNSQKRGESDQSLAGVEAKRQRNSCESESPSVPCSWVVQTDSQNSTSGWRSAGRARFHRSHSETEVMIKSALSRAELHPDLIGDFSKPYCLPLMSSAKHPDLKAISADTVTLLLRGDFSESVESFSIVDCRFPYEFTGGHIQGAKNIYTREDLMAEFFTSPPEPDRSFSLTKKRDILIFHCEFSSERAPNLSRFLRRKDRDHNINDYPHLFYPEVYLLDGGYKNFYEQFTDLCSPSGYVPMLHADHKDDLKYYRAKSLSWSNDKTRLPSKVK